MNRHLLPEEIDQLLDHEEGFGVAPLREHLDTCPDCQSRYDALQRVALVLEGLPHLHPAPLFAERVMAQVEVYEPWHVAARNTFGRFVPRSSAGRVLAGGVGAAAAMGVTAGLLWVGQRADAVLFVGNFGLQRLREEAGQQVTTAAASFLGSGVLPSLHGGNLMLAAGATAVGIGVVAAGMKAIASAARRRRD